MLKSFVYYLYLLSYIVIPLISYFYISPRKGLQLKHVVLTCFGYAVLLSWTLFISKETLVSLFSFLLFIPLILNTYFFVEGSKLFRFSIFVTFYVLEVFMEAVSSTCAAIVSLAFPKWHISSIFSGLAGNELSFFIVSCFNIFWKIILLIYIKKFSKKYLHLITDQVLLFLCLPIVFVNITGNILLSIGAKSFQYLFIELIIAAILSFFAMHTFSHGLKKLELQEQQYMEQHNQIVLLQKEVAHIHDMNSEYEQLYRWNHDIANHLMALSILSQRGEYKKALDYIRQLKSTKGGTL